MKPLPVQPLIVGHSSGSLASGTPLRLQVGGHGRVIVFAYIEIVHVGPVNGPPPVTALLPHFDLKFRITALRLVKLTGRMI